MIVIFRLISKAGAISEKKLDEFLGWYPIMKKRSEEGSELGPDAMAIERQLQECKVSCFTFFDERMIKLFPQLHRKVGIHSF